MMLQKKNDDDGISEVPSGVAMAKTLLPFLYYFLWCFQVREDLQTATERAFKALFSIVLKVVISG